MDHGRKDKGMNYEEFVEAMLHEVAKLMGPDVNVKTHRITKNNGAKKVAIVIFKNGVNISPTIYQEEFYEQYREGATVQQLARTIKEFYEKVCVMKTTNLEHILDYAKMKEKIAYKLVNKAQNEEMLQSIPNKEVLDLAMVCYLVLEDQELGEGSVMIGKEHLKHWGITEKELFSRAMENTERILPHVRMELTDIMHVHTNEKGYQGAAILLYSDVLQQEYERLGENFYIIPSSIHEVIIVPESCDMQRPELEALLQEINEKEVRLEEVLSDHVYYYSGKEQKIIL